jgi:hypothetical protein
MTIKLDWQVEADAAVIAARERQRLDAKLADYGYQRP